MTEPTSGGRSADFQGQDGASGSNMVSPSLATHEDRLKALSDHIAHLAAACPLPTVPDDITLAGLPIHQTVLGESGPDVLIVHGGVQGGLGGGPDTFEGQKALVADGWKVRLVDRPGFGKSPSRGPDDMMADAAWIADMLQSETHLVGHSWGGAGALLAAARYPAAVRSLVLIEPALEMLASTDPAFATDPVVQAANAKRFAGWMNSQTPAEYGRVFSDSLGVPNTVPPDASEEDTRLAVTRLGCAFLNAKMAPVSAFQDAVSTVARSTIPVLVISGGWSRSFDLVGEIVAKMLGGQHVIIPAPNHFVHTENPDMFNKVVSAFMKFAQSGGLPG